MPVREYYKGELVNLNWDFVDALAGGGGAVAGGAGGSQIDGLPVTGGLGGLGTVVGLGLSTLRTRDLLMFLEDYQLTKEEHERRFEGLEYGAFTVEGQIDFGTMEPRFTFFIDSDIGNAYRLNFNQYRVHLVRRSDGHTFFWGVTEKESYGLKWTVEVVPGGLRHKVSVDGELMGEATDSTTDLTGSMLRVVVHGEAPPEGIYIGKIRAWEI